MMKYIIFILLMSLMVSCKSIPKHDFTHLSPSENSIVYIYREHNPSGAGLSPKAYLNSLFIGKVKNSNIIKTVVPAGKYELLLGKKPNDWILWGFDNITQIVTFESGKKYFFKLTIDSSNFSVSTMLSSGGFIPTIDGELVPIFTRENEKKSKLAFSIIEQRKAKLKEELGEIFQ